MEPEFSSDNDSFLLVLKNLNYTNSKTAIKNGDKKTAIKNGDKKVTTKMQLQYDLILNYMERDKEYRIQDFCDLLHLKESRTKVILKGLITESRIEPIGANRDRKYILK
jgi:ATP-dependent DNA helicase RecG